MKVRIKEWYEMTEEFSVDEDGSIKCRFLDEDGDIICYCSFTKDMKEYCGKIIEVEGAIFSTFDDTNVFIYNGWFFSDDMYEVIEE